MLPPTTGCTVGRLGSGTGVGLSLAPRATGTPPAHPHVQGSLQATGMSALSPKDFLPHTEAAEERGTVTVVCGTEADKPATPWN